ncbi:MAG: hypothetical protein ACOCXP_04020 [Candidatus Dojkabacteria bacterium]
MEIATIIALILGILLVPPLSWWLNRKQPLSVVFKTIDFSFLTIFTTFILSRVYGLVFYADNLPNEWGLLPLDETAGQLEWFTYLPWALFNPFDGYFFLLELFSAFLFAHFFYALFNGRRVNLLAISKQRYQSLAISSIALLPFALVGIANGYLASDFDPAWPTMLALLLALQFLLIINLLEDRLLLKIASVAIQALAVLITYLTQSSVSSEGSMLRLNALALIFLVFNSLIAYYEHSASRKAHTEAREWRKG